MADAKRDLQATARQIGGRAGFTPEQLSLWMGLIEQESGWNPTAVGPETKKWGKAKGLGQLIDATAKRFNVKDPFDPIQNLSASAKYFKQLIDEFGDAGLALAAYNWGEGNVRGLIQNPNRYSVPEETAKYVPSVLALSGKYGPTSAPSTATLAFFPNSKNAMRRDVDQGVRTRTGAAQIRDVENKIATRGASLSPQQSSGGAAPEMEAPSGQLPQDPLALQASPTAAGLVTRTERAAGAKTLSDFLRTQFGPIADVADPLPKTYDAELRRIIDEA